MKMTHSVTIEGIRENRGFSTLPQTYTLAEMGYMPGDKINY